jgi:hypothetical protein
MAVVFAPPRGSRTARFEEAVKSERWACHCRRTRLRWDGRFFTSAEDLRAGGLREGAGRSGREAQRFSRVAAGGL